MKFLFFKKKQPKAEARCFCCKEKSANKHWVEYLFTVGSGICPSCIAQAEKDRQLQAFRARLHA